MRHIRYNKVKVSTSDDVFIHVIGDTHIGHKNCDIDFLHDKLSDIPIGDEHHRILLMGDLLDCGTKSSVGASAYEQWENPNEQLNYLVKLYKPYANQIDGVVMGNHEYRIFKESGVDVIEQFCNQLNLPYLLYSGVVTYSVGMYEHKRAYNINMIHGNAGGQIGNALNRCKMMSNKVTADVYLMGHCHHNAHVGRIMKYVDSRNEKIVEGKQQFVLTGHCLSYDDSYADMANLEISPKGFPVLQLHSTGRKMVTITS